MQFLPRRLQLSLAILASVSLFGIVGYMIVEGLSFLDALYMTLITISTVGFAEVGGPLSDSGRVLTMVLIVGGVGAVLYTAGIAFEFSIETVLLGNRELRRMKSRIDGLEDHIILCGFGRVGRDVLTELHDSNVDVVVIDRDEEIVEQAKEMGALALVGDATTDEVLLEAGIERANVLICAVRSDSENLVIALSARARREDIFIIARVLEAESERKLYLAGANRVVAPQLVGAQRIAALAAQSDVAEFIDFMVRGQLVEMRIEELDVGAGTALAGRSLRDLDLRAQSGALVLAVVSEDGRMSFNPDPALPIQPGQGIVAIGRDEQLERLRSLATGPVQAYPQS